MYLLNLFCIPNLLVLLLLLFAFVDNSAEVVSMENQKLSAYDSSSIVTTENKEELQEDVTGVGESDIYNQAQKAMYNSEVNLQKSASMRKELQQYVDSVSNMLDSEGKPLVQIPANFATIVESMNRQDVVSTEERPWIKYLLAETFDKQLEKEFEGRYRTVVSTQEESIQRGLAKINLLDRQLKEIESKSSSPRSSRLQAGRVANNFTQGGADFPDRDETFITKIRSEGRLSRKKERDGEDSQQTTAREEEELKEEEQQFNKASHRDLSMEDEKKLAALLELDDNQFADMNKYYGDSEDFINARTAIDEKLEKYGRMERIRSRASSANTNGVPETKRGRSEDVKGSAPDYLTQQVKQLLN